MRKHSAW